MKELRILGIAASIRNRGNTGELKEAILNINCKEDLEYLIEKLSRSKRISNSEACLIASLYGAVKEGASIDILPLNKYFSVNYSKRGKKEEALLKDMGEFDGLVIATPVYFGDRSSYAESFINVLKMNGLFRDKAVGVVSVGAKRNGGQETTNVYTLWEALKEGAFVCSNGPSISQYGGTAWAGDIGSIREDLSGIDTSVGVGHRVTQVAEIIKKSGSGALDSFKVSFWLTKDKDGLLEAQIMDHIGRVKTLLPDWVEFEVINITEKRIKRCLACDICPYHFDNPAQYGIFKCKVQNDDIHTIYGSLINSDAVVVAGLNLISKRGVKDAYQIFIERTRQIRRDNFLLTNVPVTAYSLEEIGLSNLFPLKVMTTFLRQNSILLRPIEQYMSGGEIVNDPHELLVDFINKAILIKKGRSQIQRRKVSYEAVGYGFKGADSLTNWRK